MNKAKLNIYDACPRCGNVRFVYEGAKGSWYLYCCISSCWESTPCIFKSFQKLSDRYPRKVEITRSLTIELLDNACEVCDSALIAESNQSKTESSDSSTQSIGRTAYCSNPECDNFFELKDINAK